jgi:hypothetical protein
VAGGWQGKWQGGRAERIVSRHGGITLIAMPSLWAASLLLLFAVIAGGLACVEAVGNGEYLAALAFAAITLTCAVGFAVPFVSRRVRQWWW